MDIGNCLETILDKSVDAATRSSIVCFTAGVVVAILVDQQRQSHNRSLKEV